MSSRSALRLRHSSGRPCRLAKPTTSLTNRQLGRSTVASGWIRGQVICLHRVVARGSARSADQIPMLNRPVPSPVLDASSGYGLMLLPCECSWRNLESVQSDSNNATRNFCCVLSKRWRLRWSVRLQRSSSIAGWGDRIDRGSTGPASRGPVPQPGRWPGIPRRAAQADLAGMRLPPLVASA